MSPRRLLPQMPPRALAARAGAISAAAGLALLALPGVAWAALGVELVALAFWLWARAQPDRADQLPRWGWLRRPAMALWLAVALSQVLPVTERPTLVAPEVPGALPGFGA